jgi:hypothetical protein
VREPLGPSERRAVNFGSGTPIALLLQGQMTELFGRERLLAAIRCPPSLQVDQPLPAARSKRLGCNFPMKPPCLRS